MNKETIRWAIIGVVVLCFVTQNFWPLAIVFVISIVVILVGGVFNTAGGISDHITNLFHKKEDNK